MDSTMTRTRRYLAYFGRSFFKDKVALMFLFLIVVTLVAIIIVAAIPDKSGKLKTSYESTYEFLKL